MNTPNSTYRWRRRPVFKVRVTWLAMVGVLCLMAHKTLLQVFPAAGMGFKVLTFILVVIVPLIALALWRLGLLPPERVLVPGVDEAVAAEPPAP